MLTCECKDHGWCVVEVAGLCTAT